MRRDHCEGVLVGLVVGAGIGLLAGLLTAPTSGRDARRRLSLAGSQLRDEAREGIDDLLELADALADRGWELFGAEADRTRSRLAELKADVERLSSVRG
jgi:gas vesicle protein